MSEEKYFLCIHGHFYQPPRENPWIEEIEKQESAAPFHDWNERIFYECYLPNSKARVLDDKGVIVDIVNNFKKISFNFGPTLMSWLEARYPEAYRDILAADRISVEAHGGHGNAIAQVYNHLIMPLAKRRDKVTQVRWGIADFRHRFKRLPESIWLAETACNEETLEVLVEEGIQFIILEPNQAAEVRLLDSEKWHDVSQGQIDPKRPYRCFLKKHPKKFIDIFFYDGPVSRAMGFGDLLFEAKMFMNQINHARVPSLPGPQLINLATDGESYGHHKAFGDRALAYLLSTEALKNGYQIVNYGEYLEEFPPQWVVRLKDGDSGEGTSWSCPHGVARWKDHCGCRGGGAPEWSQHWRKPLREALDWLSDRLDKIYENQAAVFFKKPWDVRDAYIQVILDRSEKNVEKFLKEHARGLLKKEEISCSLKLLEMQRHAMLMYTSCAWFFTELSGIETVQVIQYAARAIQLAQQVSGEVIEPEFLEKLAHAKSNIPEFKDGKHIYQTQVTPKIVSLEHATSFYAIRSLAEESFESEQKEPHKVYCFQIHVLHQRRESFGDLTLLCGRVRVVSEITREEEDLVFVALQIGMYEFRCSVKPFAGAEEMEKTESVLFHELRALNTVELLRKLDGLFGKKYYSLRDLPLHERMKIISVLTHDVIEKISAAHETLYEENRRMSEFYGATNLPIPEEIRYAIEHTLKRKLMTSVRELAAQHFNPKKAVAFYRIIDHAKTLNVEIKKDEIPVFLGKELEKRADTFAAGLREETVVECLNIHKIAKKIKSDVDQRKAQEELFAVLKRWEADPRTMPLWVREHRNAILQLLSDFRIHPHDFKKLLV